MRVLQARTGGSSELSEAMTELNHAIDDLRSLARGLSPVLLVDAGLGAALHGLAESGRLRVVGVPSERFAPVVESTAYAVEQASAGGAVEVRIRHETPHRRAEVIADERLGTSMR